MNITETKPIDARPAPATDAVLVRLPHFKLEGDSLFFLISKRPFAVLSPAEQHLWIALEKEPTVGELRTQLGAGTDESIRRLLELEVAVEVLPVPPGKRKRVMVIEPHMDDAALSVGGMMLQRRGECEFYIITIATQSVATSYRGLNREFFDIKTVSDIRKAESALVARMLWGRHVGLELVDATLRYNPQNWTLEWFRRHQDAIWVCLEHFAGQKELDQWTSTLARAIADLQPEEIWMPLGVGVHVDHHLTRHACLNILLANPKLVEQSACHFFQDVPYAQNDPTHTAALVSAIEGTGATLEEERVDITAVMPEKRQLLSVYASQWKTKIIQARVEHCAEAVSGLPGRYGEIWYRLGTAPTRNIDMLETSPAKEAVQRVTQALPPWLRRNRNAPVIGFLLAVPTGRWAEDLQYLLDVFPHARFEVYIRTKFAGETELFASPRISIRLLHNSWGWIFDAVRIVVGRRRPLVIIPGRQREKLGQSLARLSLFSTPLVAPAMSDLVQALRLVTSDEQPPL